jgi:hypothetical protein
LRSIHFINKIKGKIPHRKIPINSTAHAGRTRKKALPVCPAGPFLIKN